MDSVVSNFAQHAHGTMLDELSVVCIDAFYCLRGWFLETSAWKHGWFLGRSLKLPVIQEHNIVQIASFTNTRVEIVRKTVTVGQDKWVVFSIDACRHQQSCRIKSHHLDYMDISIYSSLKKDKVHVLPEKKNRNAFSALILLCYPIQAKCSDSAWGETTVLSPASLTVWKRGPVKSNSQYWFKRGSGLTTCIWGVLLCAKVSPCFRQIFFFSFECKEEKLFRVAKQSQENTGLQKRIIDGSKGMVCVIQP